MHELVPALRNDLELFPIQHSGQQLILIRDHLGLVQEGKAVPLPLYQFMILLNGTCTIRDLQEELMRQGGGMLVNTDEIQTILDGLDESYLLNSKKFIEARDQIISRFVSMKVRPCSHSGSAYPDDPEALRTRLGEMLSTHSPDTEQQGKITALVTPHIDLAVGAGVYGRAYSLISEMKPKRVVLLGVGHKMGEELFSLTEKDFETPLGLVKNESPLTERLRSAGEGCIAPHDFAHQSEHSIEFQLIFLQYLFDGSPFTLIPILCGSIQGCLPQYTREAYIDRAGPFLDELRQIVQASGEETLLLAGVDFSHIGPKFGHEMPAGHLESRSERHDKALLEHLGGMDAERFWQESADVEDQFNVCGFSALACLLEVLPSSKGKVLDYQIWHEAPTRSAVSFAAMAFTAL